MLVLHNLEKAYGSFIAVNRLSLAVSKGECVAILGPSGCGKTTTLRIIAGFVPATSGRIEMGGQDITNRPAQRRNIGIVFQGYALFPHMTVSQNVAFGLEMRKLPKAEIAGRVAEALTQVRLQSMADRLPKQLSGGQQQRVALARAIVIRPNLLLLDEPLSALDAKLRDEMREEIRGIQKRLNLTTLFVTHDQSEALSMADRIVVMNEGRIEQVGTPREIYEAPNTRFVANFIGRTNFIGGKSAGATSFATDFGVSIGTARAFPADLRLVSVRPEHIRVAPRGHCAEGNILPGTIKALTYLGATISVAVDTALGKEIVAEVPSDDAIIKTLSAGDQVDLSWSNDATLPLIGA